MELNALLPLLPAHQRVHIFINTKDATQFIGTAFEIPTHFEHYDVLMLDAHRNDLFIVLAQL